MKSSLVARFYNIYTPMLGRWAITYNYNIQSTFWKKCPKTDDANTDHFGCCELKNETVPHNDDNELWPYCI